MHGDRTGLTDPMGQVTMSTFFYQKVFSGAFRTVGEAMVAAKKVVTDKDVRRTWIFFGDPAMHLKGAPEPSSTSELNRQSRAPETIADGGESHDNESDTDTRTGTHANNRPG